VHAAIFAFDVVAGLLAFALVFATPPQRNDEGDAS